METKILDQVAKEFNLPKKVIKEIYKEWVYYILNKVKELDYSSYNDQPSFIIPHIGKLVCEEYKLNAINKIKNGRIEIKKSTAKS